MSNHPYRAGSNYSDGDCWFGERDVCHSCQEQHEADGTPFAFAEVRTSLGIYAGRYCDACWATSGYRDEPASAFDPMDAGETW